MRQASKPKKTTGYKVPVKKPPNRNKMWLGVAALFGAGILAIIAGLHWGWLR